VVPIHQHLSCGVVLSNDHVHAPNSTTTKPIQITNTTEPFFVTACSEPCLFRCLKEVAIFLMTKRLAKRDFSLSTLIGFTTHTATLNLILGTPPRSDPWHNSYGGV
jgi:hypothetical protein